MNIQVVKFISALVIALTLCSFTPLNQANPELIKKNEVVFFQSNEDSVTANGLQSGLENYKTKIIRMKIAISTQTDTCKNVLEKVKELFFDDIFSDSEYFSNSTLLHCYFDEQTGLANRLDISSFIDPKNEDAADELDAMIAETRGTDLWGTPFTIEDAKEVILSLTLTIGQKDSMEDFVMGVYFTAQSAFLFKSNYEVLQTFVADQKKRFRSHDPKVVFPFYDQWFFEGEQVSEASLSKLIKSANYIHIRVQRNFIMESGEKLFSAKYNTHYAHACLNEPQQKCL